MARGEPVKISGDSAEIGVKGKGLSSRPAYTLFVTPDAQPRPRRVYEEAFTEGAARITAIRRPASTALLAYWTFSCHTSLNDAEALLRQFRGVREHRSGK